MTVSVIIPCFNAEEWIRATLQSIQGGQEHQLEIIVVDDGSRDDSPWIVTREFPEVRLIRTTNQGASHARNIGTQAATGEFIQCLDADDLLAPGKIGIQLQALAETGADVAYGDWQKLTAGDDGEFATGELITREIRCEPEIALFTDFWCPPAAYLFRRSIVDATGGWNLNLPIIQDARFALDCALHGGKFVYCPGVMAMYRVHSNGSLSSRDPAAFVRDVFRNACEVEQWWRANGGLTPERRQAVVSCYGYVARASYEKDRQTFDQAYQAIGRISERYIPEGPGHLATASRLIGYRRAEAAALVYRRAKQLLGGRSA
jgi:glycosyltransferase involved in cell wall biosynthesis